MKRVRRIIFNALTVLSLLLCVATVGLWVRSYWIEDSYNRLKTAVVSRQGAVIYLNLTGTVFVDPDPLAYGYNRQRTSETNGGWDIIWTGMKCESFLGFRRGALAATSPTSYYLWAAPFWPFATVAAILPALWMANRWKTKSRARSGRCTKCGYDLRATPDRCPECGKIARTSANPAHV